MYPHFVTSAYKCWCKNCVWCSKTRQTIRETRICITFRFPALKEYSQIVKNLSARLWMVGISLPKHRLPAGGFSVIMQFPLISMCRYSTLMTCTSAKQWRVCLKMHRFLWEMLDSWLQPLFNLNDRLFQTLHKQKPADASHNLQSFLYSYKGAYGGLDKWMPFLKQS